MSEKARIYKIELYVCDLENNLTVPELEEMINDYVLSRTSTNGFCRLFKIKENEIDWNDDVQLNNIASNAKRETWENALMEDNENG